MASYVLSGPPGVLQCRGNVDEPTSDLFFLLFFLINLQMVGGPFYILVLKNVWSYVVQVRTESSFQPIIPQLFLIKTYLLSWKDLIHPRFNILMSLNLCFSWKFSVRNSHTKDLCRNYLSVITGETVNQHKLTNQIVWNMYLRNKHTFNYNDKHRFKVPKNRLKVFIPHFFPCESKV